MFLEAIALRLEAITNNKKLLGEACWIGDGLWDLATRLNGFPFLPTCKPCPAVEHVTLVRSSGMFRVYPFFWVSVFCLLKVEKGNK